MSKKEHLQKTAADFMAPIRGATHGSVVGKGALIGGAIGAGIGALKKPRKDEEGKVKSRLQNAAIGGAMGAGAGMIGGHLLHTSKPGGKIENRINAGIDTAKDTKTYKKLEGHYGNIKDKYNVYKQKKEFGGIEDYNTLMKDRKKPLSKEEVAGFRKRMENEKKLKESGGKIYSDKKDTLEQVTDKRGFLRKKIDAFKEKRNERKEKKKDIQKAKEHLEKVDTRTGKVNQSMQTEDKGFTIKGKKPKAEALKTETPKVETPKAETPKAEALKENSKKYKTLYEIKKETKINSMKNKLDKITDTGDEIQNNINKLK